MADSSRADQMRRFQDILRVSLRFGFSYYLDRKGKKGHLDPVKLRRALEELGGTFVKLGQLLSLRPDLIPREYCEELSKLQDHVEPFSIQEAQETLKKELKEKAEFIILKKLIAAASIGQVYLAEIKGERVAIKIMRPGIEKTITTDLALLHHVATLLHKHLDKAVIDPSEIYDQFRLYTENELDYLKEARNIEKFHENFLRTQITIPHVYWHFTTRRVLTMQYIEGAPLYAAKLSVQEKRKVVDDVYNAILKQIFIDGFFHGDPHPGNILITPKKRVAFIDFGIVGMINDRLKNNLADLFIAMIEKDLEKMVDAFLSLNLVTSSVDREEFKGDLVALFGKYYNTEIKAVNLGELIFRSIDIAKKNNIKLPKDYVLLGKTIVTLEGSCKRIMPSFNLVRESRPFVRHLIAERFGPKHLARMIKQGMPRLARFLVDIPERADYFLSEMKDLDDRISLMDHELTRTRISLNQGMNRIVMGMVIAALLICFALILPINIPIAYVMLGLAIILLMYYAITSVRE